MPIALSSNTTSQNAQNPSKKLIVYFAISIRLEPRYMTFISGTSQLCTLISARGRFKPKSPEHEYLQKNLEEVTKALVLEPDKGHGRHTSYLPDMVAALRTALEKFRLLGIDALELQEIVIEIYEAAEEHGIEVMEAISV
ncbi:MAG: hypothetical protein Q9213_000677 [Squamulea squamosa]